MQKLEAVRTTEIKDLRAASLEAVVSQDPARQEIKLFIGGVDLKSKQYPLEKFREALVAAQRKNGVIEITLDSTRNPDVIIVTRPQFIKLLHEAGL